MRFRQIGTAPDSRLKAEKKTFKKNKSLFVVNKLFKNISHNSTHQREAITLVCAVINPIEAVETIPYQETKCFFCSYHEHAPKRQQQELAINLFHCLFFFVNFANFASIQNNHFA